MTICNDDLCKPLIFQRKRGIAYDENGGRVWSFEESLFEDHFANYNKNINATINIKKNTMTGNGNTAEAVLKYIHTYQKTTGSVSMNVGSDSVSAGFTLSNVKNQWSLVCNITGIYY